MSAERSGISIVKASERPLHVIGCAHCSRDSLTILWSGKIMWDSPHGKGSHTNGTTIQDLLRRASPVLDVATLKDLRRIIDEKLEAA